MTNQNVVVSDAKSGIGKAVTVPASPLFPEALPEEPASPAVSERKLASSWVDSMRDSSPTRNRKPQPEDQTKASWILRHPSALGQFEQIINAFEGKQIVMFLDYDGTLSPIVEDPDRAFMTNEMRQAVRDVAKYFPTAIVSGRCRAKVYNFVRLSQLYYAGSHGMDIKGPGKGGKSRKGNEGLLCQPARDFYPMIDKAYKALTEKTKSISGAKVENNKYCVSVHYRCVNEKSWSALAEQVRSVLNEYPNLRLTQGRKVLEVRPTIKWDKGKALEFLLEALGYANSDKVLPIYIGDDQTDEDAFKVLRDRGQGIGILVTKDPKETNASYFLQEPSEVMCFLRRLVEWKQSLGGRESHLSGTKIEAMMNDDPLCEFTSHGN
ncbi:probable trehalose-phosphate phosphatase D isoform X2 [Diospyros lotus]|uniref:probable trehalose-phosphate phosphatase D isoform X2 n=1 Tax=Diospyros lotus TaxID=55363 RepID=UPI00224E34E5|nr:probable trehalose-phosphate phosphatase D isoform X2 [Diospyros lotus]